MRRYLHRVTRCRAEVKTTSSFLRIVNAGRGQLMRLSRYVTASIPHRRRFRHARLARTAKYLIDYT